MEQLQIHSRSYLVRWVDVKSEHTISWSIQPHKKAINFGIFKHPGSHIAPAPRVGSSTFDVPPTPGIKPSDAVDGTPKDSGAIEKLQNIGLKLVQWHGTCEANQVTSGTYDVPTAEGGMYALVFDNTFAKQGSKTATFVLLTYPTNAAPQSNHQVRVVQGTAKPVKAKTRPKIPTEHGQQRSSDSLPTTAFQDGTSDTLAGSRELSVSSASSNFFTGTLQKRRRKKHQGYARRYFALDFSSSTLSYYHNRHTVVMRGSVPLSVAAIGTNEATREISIDSGAEVWHLKASNKKDFTVWKEALEVASMINSTASMADTGFEPIRRSTTLRQINPQEEREWMRIEELVGRLAQSRSTARHLAKDTDPKYMPSGTAMANVGFGQHISSSEASPSDFAAADDYFESGERRPFWKRKQSRGKIELPKRSASAQSNPTVPGRNGSVEHSMPPPRLQDLLTEDGIHDKCMTLLRDLDTLYLDFSTLLSESKQRRNPAPLLSSRLSMDSIGSQEFFDADAGDSQLLTIHRSDDEDATPEATPEHDADSSASDIEEGDGIERSTIFAKGAYGLFPSKPKGQILPSLDPVKRRTTLPMPKMQPPSLIGFLRKNVGKDLSSVAMPVTANEPLSLLQKIAEMMEYSTLLDTAADPSLSSTDRLLYVTAFAISSLSNARVKERAMRKPFNPMLGETFELVREDRGYRFVAEKVTHRPVRMACQADSANWSVSQSPAPTQKFWGKSAEIIMEGRVRLTMHTNGEHFSWLPPTCFLRNVIAGEKYVEPVNTFEVWNDTTGEHTLVSFKAGGMFSGRSEEVSVTTFSPRGEQLPTGLTGKWTNSLSVVDGSGMPRGSPIWSAGPLVPDATTRWGFPVFAAQLNELVPGTEATLPPSDSRLRPDQRAAEEGRIDDAETLKARLEEAQRKRRGEMEARDEPWTPAWFTRVEGVEGEEVWMLKSREGGYWEGRSKGDWKRARKVFEIN